MPVQARAKRRKVAASNAQIAELLRRYSAVLGFQGADRFKVKAYRRAAETIESLATDVSKYVAEGNDLEDLPGIGKAISGVIREIVASGTYRRLDESLANLDPKLLELASRPALDPKKVLRAYKKLGISTLDELKERLDSGEIGKVLGPRLEFHFRQGFDERPRMLLWNALPLAEKIEAFLRSLPGVRRVAATGSLRREKDTVGSLDFLVCGSTPATIFKRFQKFGAVRSAQTIGKLEARFQLGSGNYLHLRWTKPEQWGWALLQSTGSPAHLEELAAAGKQRVELSAKGLAARDISCREETTIYEGLGFPFIEPELREGRGEVQAARSGALPRLLCEDDLRGDLHMHTTASDGANCIAQMAEAARQRGYEYIAITDHSQSLKITNGLSEKRLFEHLKEIDKVNSRLESFVILKSAEVDILEDGSLDYSNAALKELDLTICSIHSRFALNREQQTERLMRAMDNPYFNILGHATGRLLLKREGYEVDLERLLRHARENGCFFEINSSPDRLDLSDEHAKLAKELGIKIAVSTDAHSTRELAFMAAGVRQARRGWLAPSDVLNTLPWSRLRRELRRR